MEWLVDTDGLGKLVATLCLICLAVAVTPAYASLFKRKSFD